jgi:hypothetical protein
MMGGSGLEPRDAVRSRLRPWTSRRALELWPSLTCCTCEPDEILAARLSEGGATDVSAWLRADRRR